MKRKCKKIKTQHRERQDREGHRSKEELIIIDGRKYNGKAVEGDSVVIVVVVVAFRCCPLETEV